MPYRFRPLFLALVLWMPASLALAQTVTFTKVADTGTPIPGGTGTFGSPLPFQGVALDEGTVAFSASGQNDQEGVYAWSGGALRRVADGSTLMPTNGQPLEFFGGPSSDDGRIVFTGYTSFIGQEGIFRDTAGSLQLVVGPNTSVPGGSGNFNSFGPSVALHGNDLVFIGGVQDFFGTHSQQGVYALLSGSLVRIADLNTTIPGGTTHFNGFRQVGFDGSTIAFSVPIPATTADQAIYRYANGTLTRVVDTNTPVPGGTGSFFNIGNFCVDGGNVTFIGIGSNAEFGIYEADASGTLRVIADRSTVAPGGSQTFNQFYTLSCSDGNVAFTAATNAINPVGLYKEINGRFVKVLRTGDTLDGKTVESLSLSQESMDGSEIAFKVEFTDSTDGLYVAAVGCQPTPTRLCLNGGRFAVTTTWETPQGQSGVGNAIQLTADTGYFWFFNQENVEVVVKVLNACSRGRYWVFASGLTNVEVELRVEDTLTGEVRTYTNPQRTAFQPIQDTSAFATCP
ncbi:MAG TPA: hypothetical protein VF756_20260 [Thermoanaerobaculia bacterium]